MHSGAGSHAKQTSNTLSCMPFFDCFVDFRCQAAGGSKEQQGVRKGMDAGNSFASLSLDNVSASVSVDSRGNTLPKFMVSSPLPLCSQEISLLITEI